METNREKIRRRLEQDGWELLRHGKAHDLYRHPERDALVTLPRHKRLSPLVVRSIAKAAGWKDF
jgi:predicted RNA binding protein YcfA (HicA-like mRNA interferase family)